MKKSGKICKNLLKVYFYLPHYLLSMVFNEFFQEFYNDEKSVEQGGCQLDAFSHSAISYLTWCLLLVY